MGKVTDAREERYESPKGPDSDLDFTFDWGPDGNNWLQGDVIQTSAWEIQGPDASLVIGANGTSNTQTAATAWLAGGTEGRWYRAVNTITTVSGREDSRTLHIYILQR